MSQLPAFFDNAFDEESRNFDSFALDSLNTLPLGLITKGTISTASDRDYYEFILTPSNYTITMTSDSSLYGWNTFQNDRFLEFDIIDETGTIIRSSSASDLFDDSDTFTYTGTTKTFYVDVHSTGSSPADYALTLINLSINNNAPVADDDTLTAIAGKAVTINIGANDSDPDSDPLATTGLTNPTKGTVRYTDNSTTADTVTYTPASTATGTDSFTYQVSDGIGGIDTATVSVTINTEGVDKALTTVSGLRTSLDISSEVGSNNFVISSAPTNGNAYAYDKSSIVFDDAYYAATNPDVVIDIAQGIYQSFEDHYYNGPGGDVFGGSNPNANFDTSFYLGNNPDVVIALSQGFFENAFTHFQTIGVYEGRLPSTNIDNDTFVYVPNANFVGTDSFAYSITDTLGNAIDEVRVDVSVVDETNNVIRFFNTQTSTHFYSSSAVERDRILLNMPHFTLEGPTFRAADPTNAAADTVFRFFNTQTGTHFFTQSTVERDNILDTLPQFSFEGEAYKGYT